MADGLQFTGFTTMADRIRAYRQAIGFSIKMIAYKYAALFESHAKQHASWQDQTANARQSLHAWVDEVSDTMYRVFLSHGVFYGLYLEVRFAARYAIIYPTIQRHLPEIRSDLQKIFS